MSGSDPKTVLHYHIRELIAGSEDIERFAAADARTGEARLLHALTAAAARRRGLADLFVQGTTLLRDRWARSRRTGAPAPTHLIEVFDCGRLEIDGSDRPFYVTESVERTLGRAMEQGGGPWPVDKVLAIGYQVSDALAELYALGVAAHRHLTPWDVFLTDAGDVKLGVGLVAWDERGLHHRALAPEAARGIEFVDRSADLYGLAMILHQLATGPDLDAGVAGWASDGPAPALDRELVHLIARCTNANPAERLRDPTSFRAALDQIAGSSRARAIPAARFPQTGARGEAAEGATIEFAGEPVRPARWADRALARLGIGGAGSDYRFGRQAPDAAPAVRRRGAGAIALALVATLGILALYSLDKPGADRPRVAAEERAREILEELAALPTRLLHPTAAVPERTEPAPIERLSARARVLLERGDLDGAIRAGSRALALDPERPEVHRTLAVAHLRKLEFDGAIAGFREAIRLEPPNASAHTDIGWMLEQVGRYGEAAEELGRAVALDPDSTHPRLSLARVLLKDGKTKEAFHTYREAIEIARTTPQSGGMPTEAPRREAVDRAVDAFGSARAKAGGSGYQAYVDEAAEADEILRRRVPK